jgi:cysteinyl-tRNA synthetase
MTGHKEVFEPLAPDIVRMYVCGVTVYDYCHLGHARSGLVFDVMRRYLEFCGFRVEFAKNFTDVDDKIINRARELQVPWQTVTSTYIEAYCEDMARLGVRPPTVEPKATEHMADIIRLIGTLLRKGLAYQVDGDVYFQVEKFPAYGRLSKRKIDAMQAGARVDVDERKRHPMDFALWKVAKPGEPAWDSPWGPGRPGWHIECSAMSIRHLGETFDIHGGGADLIFPHHENEIAQSSGATGREFARYWAHNGFVQINQEKMSKSLGNFFSVREIFEKASEQRGYSDQVTAEALRYFLLLTHYRSPLDFSDQGLQEAKRALDGFYGLFQRLEEQPDREQDGDPRIHDVVHRLEEAFRQAMDDDFNTPAAIAQFQTLRSKVNKSLEAGLSLKARAQALHAFRHAGRVLELFQLPVKVWKFAPQVRASQEVPSGELTETMANAEFTEGEIERHIEERNEARKRKDFAMADAIREALAAQGITIEDRPDGTSRWKR